MQSLNHQITADEEYALYPVAEIKKLYQIKCQYLKEFKILQQKQEILQQQLLKQAHDALQK